MMSSCRIISIGNDEDDDDGGCVHARCSLWVITVVGSAVEYLSLGHPFIQQQLLRIISPVRHLLTKANAMANHHPPSEFSAQSTATIDRWNSFRKSDFQNFNSTIYLTYFFLSLSTLTLPNKLQLTFSRTSSIRIILVRCIT